MLFPHTPEFMQPAGESSPAQHPRTGLRRRLPFARIFATRSARLTIPPARTPTHKTPGLFFTLGVPSVTPLSYTPHLIRRLLLRDNLQTIRKFCFAVSFRVRAKFWTGIDSVREIPPPPLRRSGCVFLTLILGGYLSDRCPGISSKKNIAESLCCIQNRFVFGI